MNKNNTNLKAQVSFAKLWSKQVSFTHAQSASMISAWSRPVKTMATLPSALGLSKEVQSRLLTTRWPSGWSRCRQTWRLSKTRCKRCASGNASTMASKQGCSSRSHTKQSGHKLWPLELCLKIYLARSSKFTKSVMKSGSNQVTRP